MKATKIKKKSKEGGAMEPTAVLDSGSSRSLSGLSDREGDRVLASERTCVFPAHATFERAIIVVERKSSAVTVMQAKIDGRKAHAQLLVSSEHDIKHIANLENELAAFSQVCFNTRGRCQIQPLKCVFNPFSLNCSCGNFRPYVVGLWYAAWMCGMCAWVCAPACLVLRPDITLCLSSQFLGQGRSNVFAQ
jgi:hypothetical protein